MMTIDGTDEKFYKVTHALGFKSITYPKGLVLKMKEYGSLDAELMPYDSDANPLFGGTVCYFNKNENPKPWSGPEDGLPPVGLRVEVLWSSITEEYVDALILAHDEDRAVFRFVTGDRKGQYQADKLHFSSHKKLPNFRAIKTPDQIAAEKRETAIRELMDIAQVDCRVTAARLVDAGFRRDGVLV